MQQSQFVKQK